MANLHDIAPRLAAARDGELEYRLRRDYQLKRGYYTWDVLFEEMVRSSWAMSRDMKKAAAAVTPISDAISKLAENLQSAAIPSE